jgi:3',5'-nucleoside bisphosphate phosphatase
MRTQTLARELALKALYQHDLRDDFTEHDLRDFCMENGRPAAAKAAMELVTGCVAHQERIDEIITLTARNWELDRMPISDRNVLRIGVFELLFRSAIPPKVAINEAIDMARKFGTENSPAFVNGILDKILTTHVLQQNT